MGQKVNPVGMRIGINRDWNSKWYANNKDFAKYLKADTEIRKYLDKKLPGENMVVLPENSEAAKNKHKAVKAGHIIMPGGSYYRDEVRKGLEEGTLSEEELDVTISYLLKAILHSNVASRYRAEELI